MHDYVQAQVFWHVAAYLILFVLKWLYILVQQQLRKSCEAY